MITNPKPGMRVRLDFGPLANAAQPYQDAVVTLTRAESPSEWYFTVDPDHPMFTHGQKYCRLSHMYPVMKPPKFASVGEAEAWLDRQSP